MATTLKFRGCVSIFFLYIMSQFANNRIEWGLSSSNYDSLKEKRKIKFSHH